ncbi:MAG TPA: MoaD/ThiS family protein [Chthoniobacterales bacterium]
MQVKVQFFSQLKEVAGAPQVGLELPEGATVAELLAHLYRVHPALEKWDRNILIGVGVEFVDRNFVIRPEDAIAIMPPVQGG